MKENSLPPEFGFTALASIGTIAPRRKNVALHFYAHKSELEAGFKFRRSKAGVRREIVGVCRRKSCASEKEAQNSVLCKCELQHVVEAKSYVCIPERNHTTAVGAKHGELLVLPLPTAKRVQRIRMGNFAHPRTSSFANPGGGGYSNHGNACCRAAFQEFLSSASVIFDYINSAALAFWDACLKGDARAKSHLLSSALERFSHGAVKISRR